MCHRCFSCKILQLLDNIRRRKFIFILYNYSRIRITSIQCVVKPANQIRSDIYPISAKKDYTTYSIL